MKIYAIVVTYNGMHWYDRCLGSLQASNVPISTIVIDNASTDNTATYIKEKFPDVHIIESKENLGFAKANNVGIRYAIDRNADYVFLLNQDAWIEPNTIKELIESCEKDPKIGIVSPVHLNGEGSNLDDFFATCIPTECISDMYFSRIKDSYITDFVNAAAWLISAECIEKVGGFDTLLFQHYGEDNNYCQRVYYHGFVIKIQTNAVIFHDRIKRSENYVFENEFSVFNQDRDLKMKYGNIQSTININQVISKMTRKSFLYLISGRFNAYKNCKKQISVYKDIKLSREKNTIGNLIWL